MSSDEIEIRERTRAIVGDLAPLAVEKITETSDLVIDLGFDSLGLAELLVTLELEFGMTAREEDDVGVETVADVEERVLELLGQRPVEANGGGPRPMLADG